MSPDSVHAQETQFSASKQDIAQTLTQFLDGVFDSNFNFSIYILFKFAIFFSEDYWKEKLKDSDDYAYYDG